MIDEDAQLMLAFKAGDRAAFERLFERWTPRLHTFLARMVRDRARAEELTQDVFVRIYKAAPRYEARTRFSTWLFGIAHNLALNELDRAHHKRERRVDSLEAYDGPQDEPDAVDQLTARRTGATLERALEALPARQRSALLLRSEQGLAYDEIAATLETSVSSVKSMIHRARQSLSSALKEVGA